MAEERKPSGEQKKASAPARAKGASQPKAGGEDAPRKKTRKVRLSARNVVDGLVPLLCVVVAFAATVAIYRYLFPRTHQSDATAAAAGEPVADSGTQVATDAYQGVDDPWTASKHFTTGDDELDQRVKALCDALTTQGQDASANAQNVYNNIMWNYTYAPVDKGQKPAGPNWVRACAKEFFSTMSSPAELGGEGDYYQFAAVIAFCLRYFGYSDAMAVPVLVPSGGEETFDAAYCLVTDENGAARVCDPTLSANGWMRDRYSYNIVVDDIGQDLSVVEGMGLYVQRSGDASSSGEDVNKHEDDVASTETTTTAESTDEYSTTESDGSYAYDYAGGYTSDYAYDYTGGYTSDYTGNYL